MRVRFLRRVTLLAVALLLSLVALADVPTARAEEGAGFGAWSMEDGLPLRRQLARCHASWLGVIHVPAGARALTVGVHASHDVDLYLTHGAPPACPFDAHAHVASRSGSSWESVRVGTGDPFPLRPGPWFVTVANPGAGVRGACFELLACVDTASTGHTVMPGRPLDVRGVLAKGGLTLRTWLPERATATTVAMGGLREGARYVLRGPHDHSASGVLRRGVRLDRGMLPAGVWSLRVAGVAQDETGPLLAHATYDEGEVTPSGALGLPSLAAGASTVLTRVGQDGPRRIQRLVLPVPRPGPGFVIQATSEGGGEVDLFVRRALPPRQGAADADWFARGAGGRASLVLGGARGLAAGRLVLEVARRADAAGRLGNHIVVARSPAGAAPVGPHAGATAVARGTWHEAPLPAPGQDARFLLVVPAGASSLHVQTVDPTADVDLVLERWTDGSVLARALSSRVAERLDYSFPGLAAAPRRFLVRVARGQGALDAGPQSVRLAWELGGPPALPSDLLWPPFMDPAPTEGESRAAAATVEISVRGGGSGSGTCVDAAGWILTSRHVLQPYGEEGALQREGILVAFPQRLDEVPVQAFEATLIAEDASLDLALLRVTRDVWGRPLDPALRFPTAPLRQGAAPAVGEAVLVVGYPTVGARTRRAPVVLTPGRVTQLDETPGGVQRLRSDTWVGTGHSGGGLFDAQGRLTGVVVAKVEPGTRAVLGLSVSVAAVPAPWRAAMRSEARR